MRFTYIVKVGQCSVSPCMLLCLLCLLLPPSGQHFSKHNQEDPRHLHLQSRVCAREDQDSLHCCRRSVQVGPCHGQIWQVSLHTTELDTHIHTYTHTHTHTHTHMHTHAHTPTYVLHACLAALYIVYICSTHPHTYCWKSQLNDTHMYVCVLLISVVFVLPAVCVYIHMYIWMFCA